MKEILIKKSLRFKNQSDSHGQTRTNEAHRLAQQSSPAGPRGPGQSPKTNFLKCHKPRFLYLKTHSVAPMRRTLKYINVGCSRRNMLRMRGLSATPARLRHPNYAQKSQIK